MKFEPAENDSQEASIYGKKFANAGGVTAAVIQCLEETQEMPISKFVPVMVQLNVRQH